MSAERIGRALDHFGWPDASPADPVFKRRSRITSVLRTTIWFMVAVSLTLAAVMVSRLALATAGWCVLALALERRYGYSRVMRERRRT